VKAVMSSRAINFPFTSLLKSFLKIPRVSSRSANFLVFRQGDEMSRKFFVLRSRLFAMKNMNSLLQIPKSKFF
jgi:hypothetical protein